VCISWTIKCLILLMHGATMKFILIHLVISCRTIKITLDVRARIDIGLRVLYKILFISTIPNSEG